MEYEIYRSTSPGVQVLDSNQVNQSQVSVSNFTDNTVQNWISYYYVVTAVDDSGNESSPSAEVQVCPHPSIEHGTVSADCTITCDEGYTLSDHTCTAPGGAVAIGGGGDTIAPSISNITVSVSSTSAKISWTTNESSISWVVYGTSTDYGSEVKTTDYLTSHSLTLTGLSPETTYHYQIKSKDSAGNIGSYTDRTFTTLPLEEVGEREEKKEKKEEKETPPVTPKPISEMTIEELRNEINRILSLISQIQALLEEKTKMIEGIPTGFTFKKNLFSGMTDQDVVYLKIVLAQEGCVSGLKNTKWFGPMTKEGVKCFCKKYKEEISKFAGYEVKCTGFVGKGIREKLNQLISR